MGRPERGAEADGGLAAARTLQGGMRGRHGPGMTRDLLQRHRALRVLVGLAIVALTIHVAQLLWAALVVAGDVVLMFLLAWIITFILAPVSARLQRIGMHRVAAVSLVYFALLVVTAGMIVVAIPAVKAEVSLFAARLTALTATNGTEGLSSTVARLLQGVGFSPADAHRLGDELGAKIPEFAASLS